VLAGLADLLLPIRCLGCGERVPDPPDGSPVCARCRARVLPPPSPRCARCDVPVGTRRAGGPGCLACADWPSVLVQARCVTALAPPADALLHALKYEGWPAVVPFLGRRMAALPLAAWAEEPVLVPVPTTPERRRRRGYNQADLLAREAGRIRGRTVLAALARPRASSSQIALPVSGRRANVEGAFAPGEAHGRIPDSAHVILVDDVVTTGATGAAAARVLESLGVRSVTLLAFARTLPAELDASSSP
jgi:ComF family protein